MDPRAGRTPPLMRPLPRPSAASDRIRPGGVTLERRQSRPGSRTSDISPGRVHTSGGGGGSDEVWTNGPPRTPATEGQAAAREVSLQPVVRVRPSAAASAEWRLQVSQSETCKCVWLGSGRWRRLGRRRRAGRRRCGGGSGGGGVECRRGTGASVVRSLVGRFRRGRRRGGTTGERSLGGRWSAGSLWRRQPGRGHHAPFTHVPPITARSTYTTLALACLAVIPAAIAAPPEPITARSTS
jgi:hypothetical protein